MAADHVKGYNYSYDTFVEEQIILPYVIVFVMFITEKN